MHCGHIYSVLKCLLLNVHVCCLEDVIPEKGYMTHIHVSIPGANVDSQIGLDSFVDSDSAVHHKSTQMNTLCVRRVDKKA